MIDEPDFRAEKSETVEGAKKAVNGLYAYLGTLDEDTA